ncbi:hypothetical protein STAS_33170 [Striga asiatica]|uniref:Uncharacterized protein n=1 Tax=Striga asiatica TaxID=4170 RepID=A0A5A7RDV1_STRAF|nr:hypothetical protein STAS_33170 [Striga asiatica]
MALWGFAGRYLMRFSIFGSLMASDKRAWTRVSVNRAPASEHWTAAGFSGSIFPASAGNRERAWEKDCFRRWEIWAASEVLVGAGVENYEYGNFLELDGCKCSKGNGVVSPLAVARGGLEGEGNKWAVNGLKCIKKKQTGRASSPSLTPSPCAQISWKGAASGR